MTKEEAIEFGNMWLQINENCKDSSTYAFFQVAIEALKQKPSAISVSKKKRTYKKQENDDWSGAQGNTINRIIEENERGHWGIYG